MNSEELAVRGALKSENIFAVARMVFAHFCCGTRINVALVGTPRLFIFC